MAETLPDHQVSVCPQIAPVLVSCDGWNEDISSVSGVYFLWEITQLSRGDFYLRTTSHSFHSVIYIDLATPNPQAKTRRQYVFQKSVDEVYLRYAGDQMYFSQQKEGTMRAECTLVWFHFRNTSDFLLNHSSLRSHPKKTSIEKPTPPWSKPIKETKDDYLWSHQDRYVYVSLVGVLVVKGNRAPYVFRMD